MLPFLSGRLLNLFRCREEKCFFHRNRQLLTSAFMQHHWGDLLDIIEMVVFFGSQDPFNPRVLSTALPLRQVNRSGAEVSVR